MFGLTEPQIDRVIAHRHYLLFGGLAIMSLPWTLPPGWGLGLFSGFMLFSLGIYGVFFRNWRTEPGLWMLAVLLTSLLGPAWAYFEFLSWRGLLVRAIARANNWEQARASIDAAIAVVLFAFTVNWSMAVATGNWKRTRVGERTYEPSTKAASNHAMQPTRDKIGPDRKSKVASR